MIFDTYFDKVVVINLEHQPERLANCKAQLKKLKLSEKFVVQKAVDGSVMTPPSWFEWGDGAWGCLRSHLRVLEDFMMEKGFEKKKILILEDDVLFFPTARNMFKKFIKKLDDEPWGQLYLGGQHTIYPEEESPGLYKCQSVNRTHAYAVHGAYVKAIYEHLTNFEDYTSPQNHIDRQLEKAHRKNLWPVYAPTWWIAGQNFGVSNVNGRYTRIQWWDLHERSAVAEVPYIYIDCDDSDVAEFLYKEKLIIKERNGVTSNNINSIGAMAWLRRLLPAFKCSDRDLIYANSKIKNLVFLSTVKDDLQKIIDQRVKYE